MTKLRDTNQILIELLVVYGFFTIIIIVIIAIIFNYQIDLSATIKIFLSIKYRKLKIISRFFKNSKIQNRYFVNMVYESFKMCAR